LSPTPGDLRIQHECRVILNPVEPSPPRHAVSMRPVATTDHGTGANAPPQRRGMLSRGQTRFSLNYMKFDSKSAGGSSRCHGPCSVRFKRRRPPVRLKRNGETGLSNLAIVRRSLSRRSLPGTLCNLLLRAHTRSREKHTVSERSFIPRAFIREGDTYKSER